MNILLGYELGTGKPVHIPLGHLVVTGQTQKSGKTTTLEALISRSGLRAVAFITKRGEKSFRTMNEIPAYFHERADWQFVQTLLEATMKQKQDFKQAWIMRAADGASTLEDVRDNIRRYLHGEKADYGGLTGKALAKAQKKREWKTAPARGLNADMYYVLDQYFEEVMPELKRLRASKTLNLAPGVNVMDLSDYSFPLQSLVMRSVLEYVYQKMTNVIVIIPEAWEFIPQGRRSPVRLAAEELIRKGAAEKNYVWLDSQDIAGVEKIMLRSMEVWLFGVQRDPRELQRTLLSIPDLPRPKASEIAVLGKGQFVAAFGNSVFKVYVQPEWIHSELHAAAIARGEEPVESATQIMREADRAKHRDQTRFGGCAIYQESADDRRAADTSARSGHPASGVDRSSAKTMELEDLMWKERAEKAEAEVKRLGEELRKLSLRLEEAIPSVGASGRASTAAIPTRDQGVISPANGSVDLPAIYDYIRSRMLADPAVVNLTANVPEINLAVKRRTIAMNDETTDGRLALLISEKFFDLPQDSSTVAKEFRRRGWLSAKTNNVPVLEPLKKITGLGFLFLEGTKYLAVPGMKVNILEE